MAPLLFPFRPLLQVAASLAVALAFLELYVTYKPFAVAADDILAELLCWLLVLTQLAVLVHEASQRRDSREVGWALLALLVGAFTTGLYLIYVDVRREREALADLVTHSKRKMGRQLSSLRSLSARRSSAIDEEAGPKSPGPA